MISDMMDEPLNIIDILIYAGEVHKRGGLVSYHAEEIGWRQTYKETIYRVAKLANAFKRMGIRPGDRIATLALNGIRHFEIYYATAAIGAVCHTINPRLSLGQLIYIINHADDKVVCADPGYMNIIKKLEGKINKELIYIALKKDREAKDDGWEIYEELIKDEKEEKHWTQWDERMACGLCYTSGTTGNPKGALYSHRSCILEAMNVIIGSGGEFQIGDRILPIVPMFHVNAWGMPFIAPLTGASLVMPGEKMTGQELYEIMDKERVAQSWGVPTVFYDLLAEMRKQKRAPRGLRRVVIGGSEPSEWMLKEFEAEFDVNAIQGWGMTEANPVGSVGILVEGERELELDERVAIQARGSRRLFGIKTKIVDEVGRELEKDAKEIGELCIKGPTVIKRYYRDEDATGKVMMNGWLRTGDMAQLGSDGMVTIVDREKDLIKSGGEWISSIDMENVAAEAPGVYECAVVAIEDEKWGERPILVVVMEDGKPVREKEIRKILGRKFAKWQLPEKIMTMEGLPHTATGKVSKLKLREMMKNI